MLYFNSDLKKFRNQSEIKKSELIKFSSELINNINKYRKFVPENNQGIFFEENRIIINKINNQNGYIKNKFNFISIKKNQNIKASIFSNILPSLGISGYYNPFFNESMFDSNLPTSIKIFTIAHENSHNFGIAPENNANFIAYILCKESNDYSLKYSADLMALKYVLKHLRSIDSVSYKHQKSKLSEKIIRDLKHEKVYYLSSNNKTSYLFSKINNLFLKFNKQEGTVSYSKFIEMILNYNK